MRYLVVSSLKPTHPLLIRIKLGSYSPGRDSISQKGKMISPMCRDWHMLILIQCLPLLHEGSKSNGAGKYKAVFVVLLEVPVLLEELLIVLESK